MMLFISYLVLGLFLAGSLYFVGLMIFIGFKGNSTKVRPLGPGGSHHPELPKAA